MARKVRIQYPGASYHIFNRGNRREPIFRSNHDSTLFLRTIGETCERTGWIIISYILMRNHYHILLETPEGNLVDGMKWFQSTYTQRFNRRHGVVGHLFQGRYKALIIDPKECEYFLSVSDYIHLNPVRAGLLDKKNPQLSKYKWSSYIYYLKSSGKRPKWLQPGKIFEELKLKKDNISGRKKYAERMNLLVSQLLKTKGKKQFEEEWNRLRQGWYLGDDKFKEKLLKYTREIINGKKRESYTGDSKRSHDEQTAVELMEKALKLFSIKRTDLQLMKKSDPKKQVIAWLLKTKTSVPNIWIAEQLHMGFRTSISNAVKNIRENKNKELKNLHAILTNTLQLSD